jgi:hypothetical protein
MLENESVTAGQTNLDMMEILEILEILEAMI